MKILQISKLLHFDFISIFIISKQYAKKLNPLLTRLLALTALNNLVKITKLKKDACQNANANFSGQCPGKKIYQETQTERAN